MAQENIKETAIAIYDIVEGEDNIMGATHCMTRLRLTLKDESIVDEEALKSLELVKGIHKAGGQFQIILGTGIVNKVFKEFSKLTGQLNENIDNRTTFQKVISFFGDVFIPVIPAIIAAGILMGLNSFLVNMGFITPGDGWYKIVSILSDTAFTFLPTLVVWSTFKKMGGTPVIGIVIGLMLVSPILPSGGAVAKGNAEALVLSVFGFQFFITSFAGRILPAMAVGVFGSYLEDITRKYMPSYLDAVFTPLIVSSLSLLVGLLVLGPIVGNVEDVFVGFYEAVIFLPLGIGGFMIAFLQQFLVITGMHHALWVVDYSLVEQFGVNAMQPLRTASVIGQTGAVFALAMFAKSKDMREISFGSFVAGMFGITEPAIFGGTLLIPGVFLCGAIGSGIGGMVARIMDLAAAGVGANALPAYFFYIGNMTEFIEFTIVMAVTFFTAFILSSIYLKKKGLTK